MRRVGWRTRFAVTSLALLIAGAVFVPPLAPISPVEIGDVIGTRYLEPGARSEDGQLHLLGTDRFGRDILARMLLAARVSLAVGVLGSLFAGALGIGIGAIAAWMGGIVDRTAMWATDALLAIPRIVLLLVFAALWQPGLRMVLIVLVLTGWMGIARLVRAELLGVRRRDYVEAAHALGASQMRILWRHALPNALGPAIVAITLGVGSAILLESGLSFLGLGIQPPLPSWGNMIAEGREAIVIAPWVALAPGLVLILTVLACTLLGDELRDRLAGEEMTELRERS